MRCNQSSDGSNRHPRPRWPQTNVDDSSTHSSPNLPLHHRSPESGHSRRSRGKPPQPGGYRPLFRILSQLNQQHAIAGGPGSRFATPHKHNHGSPAVGLTPADVLKRCSTERAEVTGGPTCNQDEAKGDDGGDHSPIADAIADEQQGSQSGSSMDLEMTIDEGGLFESFLVLKEPGSTEESDADRTAKAQASVLPGRPSPNPQPGQTDASLCGVLVAVGVAEDAKMDGSIDGVTIVSPENTSEDTSDAAASDLGDLSDVFEFLKRSKKDFEVRLTERGSRLFTPVRLIPESMSTAKSVPNTRPPKGSRDGSALRPRSPSGTSSSSEDSDPEAEASILAKDFVEKPGRDIPSPPRTCLVANSSPRKGKKKKRVRRDRVGASCSPVKSSPSHPVPSQVWIDRDGNRALANASTPREYGTPLLSPGLSPALSLVPSSVQQAHASRLATPRALTAIPRHLFLRSDAPSPESTEPWSPAPSDFIRSGAPSPDVRALDDPMSDFIGSDAVPAPEKDSEEPKSGLVRLIDDESSYSEPWKGVQGASEKGRKVIVPKSKHPTLLERMKPSGVRGVLLMPNDSLHSKADVFRSATPSERSSILRVASSMPPPTGRAPSLVKRLGTQSSQDTAVLHPPSAKVTAGSNEGSDAPSRDNSRPIALSAAAGKSSLSSLALPLSPHLKAVSLIQKLSSRFPQETAFKTLPVGDQPTSQRIRAKSNVQQQSVMVFIDHSNMYIGFTKFLQHHSLNFDSQRLSKTNGPSRSREFRLDYRSLFAILERGRYVPVRYLAASTPLYQPLDVARQAGYDIHLMERVLREDPLPKRRFKRTGSRVPPREKQATIMRMREQGLDEIIQLAIVDAVDDFDYRGRLDSRARPVLALVSGDANAGEYSKRGFRGRVSKCLRAGYDVEIFGWRGSISGFYLQEAKRAQVLDHQVDEGQLTVTYLDEFAAELVEGA